MKSHRLSSFGQKSGMIIESGDWSMPYIFLKFLKKLDGSRWEKPSQKEGKTIIIVDHRLYWLSELIDTVYIMDKGSIAEKGDFSILASDNNIKNFT